MKTIRYKLVVWDWDGTIMDTVPLIVESLQVAARQCGLPVPTNDFARSIIGLAQRETKVALFGENDIDWDAYEVAYRMHYIERERSLGLFEGMEALLRKLKVAGAHLAIATGKSDRGMRRVFDVTGLETLFSSIETASCGVSKPNPEILLKQCRRLGIKPSDTVMVGDSHLDLTMAKLAGVDAIGVTYGAQSPEKLASVHHGCLVDSIAALESALFLE